MMVTQIVKSNKTFISDIVFGHFSHCFKENVTIQVDFHLCLN